MRDAEWALEYPGVSLSWGAPGDSIVLDGPPQIGSPDIATDDARRPRADGISFGKDYRGGVSITFSLAVVADDEEEARDLAASFSRAWRGDPVRKAPGSVASLRSRLGTRERVVYGRPRRFAQDDTHAPEGVILLTCDFQCVNDVAYSKDDAVEIVSLVPPASGGIAVVPAAEPVKVENLVRNPSWENDITGAKSWSGAGGASVSETWIEDGRDGSGGAFRLVWDTASSDESGDQGWGYFPVTAGETYSASGWVRSSVAGGFHLGFFWVTEGDRTAVGSYESGGYRVEVPANTWTRVYLPDALAPAGAGEARIYFTRKTGVPWPQGATLDSDDLIVVEGDTVPPFFDGNTETDGNYSYGWTGEPHASTSERVARPTGISSPLTTTAPSSYPGGIEVGGDLPAWPVVQVDGPITDPEIQVTNEWTIALRLVVPDGDSIVVDTRPWRRTITRLSDGASFAGSLTRSSVALSQASLDPGDHEIALRGLDATGTASMRFSWHDTYSALS